jgi:hypothetical protein
VPAVPGAVYKAVVALAEAMVPPPASLTDHVHIVFVVPVTAQVYVCLAFT